MLQSIREHTQGWIAGTIIGIIILTFALWGIHSYFIGGAGNRNIAEVNGVEITRDQLAASYERLRRQQSQYGAQHPGAAMDESTIKSRAMQTLIDMEVLKQASARQGFLISDAQIDAYLQAMPEFQVDGQFSLQKLNDVLASSLMPTSELLELIRESLLIDQPKLGIIFTSISLPDEIANTLALVNQERDIAYATITTQTLLGQPIVITPEKIESYYKQHQSAFMTPEQVNVAYIQLSLKDLSANIVPTDTALKTFYKENINAWTQPSQWKIVSIEIPVSDKATEAAMQQVVKNGDALALAMKNSQDMSKLAAQYSATYNDQGWVTLQQLTADMQKAVSPLSKDDVSLPFKTPKGLMIIKAVDIQGPKILPFEAVQDKVKEAYTHQQAEEKFTELREQLADLTYEHPDSLEYAATHLNLPIKTSEMFTRNKEGKDISQYKKVRDAAFSHDVLNLQNNSDVIPLDSENLVVLHIKSHLPSTLLPLKQVSKQIEDTLKATEAMTRAEKMASEAQTRLNKGDDSAQVSHAYQLQWNDTGLIGRYSTKVDTAILDFAFRMPNPVNTQHKIYYGVTRIPTGFAIVALKSVKPGSITDKKQADIFAEQMEMSNGLLEYELYKRSQIKNASINVTDADLKQ